MIKLVFKPAPGNFKMTPWMSLGRPLKEYQIGIEYEPD